MSKSSKFYAVFTVKHLTDDHHKQVLDNLKQYVSKVQVKKSLIVLEHGPNGDHPHYNVIIELDKDVQTSNLRKQLVKIYPEGTVGPHTLRVSIIYDEDTLIGGYLRKEADYTVIANRGYDLDKIKTIVYKPKDKTFKVITLHKDNAYLVIEDYITKNNLKYNRSKSQFSYVLSQMTANGYSIHSILGCIGVVFNQLNQRYGNSYGMQSYIFNKLCKDLDEWPRPPMDDNDVIALQLDEMLNNDPLTEAAYNPVVLSDEISEN